jgi:cobalt/nickel transport system permease protein
MVGRDVDLASSRRFVAASAGALFGKAHSISEEVYLAMVARGYTGETRLLTPGRIRVRDACWCVACAGVAMMVLWGDHVVR